MTDRKLVVGVPRTELVDELATLARAGQKGSARWQEVQQQLTQYRLAELPPPTAGSRSEESIRTRVIAGLREAPGSTPSELAKTLQKQSTVVSRVLASLLEDGYVTYTGTADDRRKRLYFLSEAEQASTAVTPATDNEAERHHIALAIGGAVEARRRRHDLTYAQDRLTRLLAHATRIDAKDLALLARTELITTLRQESQSAAPELAEAYRGHLEVLANMLTDSTDLPVTLSAPLLGTLEYEWGRDPAKPTPDRLRHLTAAQMAFEWCEESAHAQAWGPKAGWALLSRAGLWRAETEFGKAQSLALRASEVFDAYDDQYGKAEAFRIIGFCQRLRGDFDGAIETLRHAVNVEGTAVSERCRADVLLQLGDAHRCKGELDTARPILSEAEALAKRLGRTVTLGFVLSSMAAVEYAAQSLDKARDCASRAAESLVGKPEGAALNRRRLAVICRELGSGGDRRQYVESVSLFREALMDYDRLNSPAGTATCLVGLGMVAGEHEDAAIRGLHKVAVSEDGRNLVPKDPWLPGLVSKWAEEIDRDDMQEVVWSFTGPFAHLEPAEMAAEPRVVSKVDAL